MCAYTKVNNTHKIKNGKMAVIMTVYAKMRKRGYTSAQRSEF